MAPIGTMFSASTMVRAAALATNGPNAFVVYLHLLRQRHCLHHRRSSGYLPEHTISGFIDLPRPYKCHIAGQSGFHKIGFAVEDSRFTRLATLKDSPSRIQRNRDISILDAGICITCNVRSRSVCLSQLPMGHSRAPVGV